MPAQSLQRSRGLDALNALVASSQTGFGAFIAVYLTSQAWTQADIGQALSLGTIVAMLSQLPAGALVDAMHSKRLAIAVGGIAVALSALLFAVSSAWLPVLGAEVLHGFASCIVGPAIAALSLQLVGRAGLGERLGRNARYSSLGSAVAAVILGGIGTYVSGAAVFWATAVLMVLAVASLRFLPPPPTGPRTADITTRTGLTTETRGLGRAVWVLLDRRLLVFAGCVVLFHLSNAAMLPLVANEVTRSTGALANLVIAACIVAPQAIVAGVSPLVGRLTGNWGRRPVLLLGFAALPARGVLLSLGTDPVFVVAVQALDGLSAAVFGVLMPLVAADLTRGTRRFNLCLGLLGLAAGAGATLSTTAAGLVADRFGNGPALLTLAAVGATAMLGVLVMPETRDARQDQMAAGVELH